jgi:hypothetical protein
MPSCPLRLNSVNHRALRTNIKYNNISTNNKAIEKLRLYSFEVREAVRQFKLWRLVLRYLVAATLLDAGKLQVAQYVRPASWRDGYFLGQPLRLCF